MSAPEFGYARASDGAYIGYHVAGEGPVDVVHQPEWPGNVDFEWEDPWMGGWLRGLTTIGRLVMHDHRGVGLSSRDVALPDLETRVADLLAVLQRVEVTRPVLTGFLSSGAVNLLAAATRPDLARAIVWMEPIPRYASAPDYPLGQTWEQLDDELAPIAGWGTETYARWFLEAEASIGNEQPDASIETINRQTRNACTPDVAKSLARIWYDTDVRAVLPTVQTPTLLITHRDRPNALEATRYVADRMPNAELVELPGVGWTLEEQPAWLDAIRRFLGQDLPAPASDTILATVLFTDIVDSTQTQARLGDRAWKVLIERHHALVRAMLERWHGTENDTAGDGFYATFAGPARAIRCALELIEGLLELGIEIRAGVHTGECELVDGKSSGLSVSIGARVMSKASASEVLVSQTVKDLVAGSGLTFEGAGEHELKGVPDRWRLYRVVS